MTREVTTSAVESIDIAGSQIKSTYATTSLGAPISGLRSTPIACASGSVAVAGDIATMTVRMSATFPGMSAPVGILSHKVGSTDADRVDWTFTAAENVALVTVEHIGANSVAVDVKGDVDGSSGDAAQFSIAGVAS